MSETAVIFMSNGKTYTVSKTPDAILADLTSNPASSSYPIQKYTLPNGKDVLLNVSHIVAVETSELSNMDVSSQDQHNPVEDNRTH
ncbi:hypothetical protein ADIAL_2037 [Alkalibacterium sp. AK22]|uniref:hypothetical protein n=1 Tax=Alkalibacterium sp. AK22 TaxID=1229520 RepID=UPI000451E2C3|nr:hypothetical protein [Alkalibacterium sp. AK22]EXJ22451.1 hypothetical protein ADIAL_2037 [Alkalibacterium sp. AK22]